MIINRKNSGYWQLAAMICIILGFTSIVLQMIGVNYAFLSFLEMPGSLFAFVAKLILAMLGFVLFVLAKTDWEQERQESED